MTYRKPEVEILGSASTVIEQIRPKPIGPMDSVTDLTHNSPAYDLDE